MAVRDANRLIVANSRVPLQSAAIAAFLCLVIGFVPAFIQNVQAGDAADLASLMQLWVANLRWQNQWAAAEVLAAIAIALQVAVHAVRLQGLGGVAAFELGRIRIFTAVAPLVGGVAVVGLASTVAGNWLHRELRIPQVPLGENLALIAIVLTVLAICLDAGRVRSLGDIGAERRSVVAELRSVESGIEAMDSGVTRRKPGERGGTAVIIALLVVPIAYPFVFGVFALTVLGVLGVALVWSLLYALLLGLGLVTGVALCLEVLDLNQPRMGWWLFGAGAITTLGGAALTVSALTELGADRSLPYAVITFVLIPLTVLVVAPWLARSAVVAVIANRPRRTFGLHGAIVILTLDSLEVRAARLRQRLIRLDADEVAGQAITLPTTLSESPQAPPAPRLGAVRRTAKRIFKL